MASSTSLPTVRRVLALKLREMRRLRGEIARAASRLSDLEGRRQGFDRERSALFETVGTPLGLGLLRLADMDREWRAWLQARHEADQDRDRLETSLAHMRAEIRALEIYADRLAAKSR